MVEIKVFPGKSSPIGGGGAKKETGGKKAIVHHGYSQSLSCGIHPVRCKRLPIGIRHAQTTFPVWGSAQYSYSRMQRNALWLQIYPPQGPAQSLRRTAFYIPGSIFRQGRAPHSAGTSRKRSRKSCADLTHNQLAGDLCGPMLFAEFSNVLQVSKIDPSVLEAYGPFIDRMLRFPAVRSWWQRQSSTFPQDSLIQRHIESRFSALDLEGRN